ncbi:hypothetical protein B0H11DRAFT_2435455 [Mycena galericulata]|nr:hypothetical protein B0H11DRAFT_2435455 [Mycena galericulata]
MSLARSQPPSVTSSNIYQRWLDSKPKLSSKDDPDKWTQQWERFLAIPQPNGLAQYQLSASHSHIDELLLSCYRGSYRDVCRIQHELSVTACNISAHYDFEKAWLGWDTTKRRDFLAQAIIRGEDTSSQYEEIRPYCREVSIAFLEGSLLDVLKTCLLDDISQIPNEPIIYPVEYMKGIDETVLPPGHALMRRYTRLRQTQLIYTVLGQALTLYLGDPAVQAPTLKGNIKLKGYPRELKKAYKALPAACERCRKPETDLKDHKMQCMHFLAFGAPGLRYVRVMIFPSECVKADWPRHKIICGKPLTVESATSTAVVVDPASGYGKAPSIIPPFTPLLRASRVCSIRPPTGGYKRSAALIRQVLLLQQNPSVDYFLSLPSKTNNLVSVSLPDDAESARFCAARDDLMSTGNSESFWVVFVALVQIAKTLIQTGRYKQEYLIVQMKKEYEVDVSP